MNKILAIFIVCLLPACTSQYKSQLVPTSTNLTKKEKIGVVAHRGCWTHAPENSVKSIENCSRLGVEMVEIDVQLTKDGELVVFHDKTLDRMTGVSGTIYEKTLGELRQLYLYERDGWPNHLIRQPVKTMHRIATLEEIFTATKGKMKINLEIKSYKYSVEETFNAAVDMAKRMGVENDVWWKVKDGKNHSADLLKTLDFQNLTDVTPILRPKKYTFQEQIREFSRLDIGSLELVTSDLSYWPLDDKGKILNSDQFIYMGIAVLPRWCGGLADEVALSDPDASWGKLAEMGFDLIMTDRPEQLIDYLEVSGYR
ncbi:glycerophosphodiester phosphodiesterase family protein [Porticoccus sp. W117]|uniref:glycerophosphodiester phosphodiesterase family protein n=1 Tax=Porticoccus sp. W117 TaxID=3054777 RepID=UPI0025989597|nr:glycerophosphodiester phosphodiesterase family protein [Porticoccus sp. W117]MDM3872209.1 glycerophosphodiester phosphodiesterase family protein [Porticoccus sp. W117]